jgi:hypothetical protein
MTDTPRTDSVVDNGGDVSYLACAEIERDLNDAKKKSASAYMELEKAMARMMEIKMKQASLIAAINTAITEFPSNQASIYLSGIMANLFQK